MEPFTLDRNYQKKDVIDGFTSMIWTERYYGDSQVEIVVPSSSDLVQKLPLGIFLGIDKSDELMILETMNSEEAGLLKYSGISVLPWLNNRFIRTSANREDRYWYIDVPTTSGSKPYPPGKLLWDMIFSMCSESSPYLRTGPQSIATGIPNPQSLAIPGLGLKSYDTSGTISSMGIAYGPLYDAMREIAITYQIGMRIVFEPVVIKVGVSQYRYFILFQSYKGLDRTSNQTVNSLVRFSPMIDSLTNIKELQSIAALKTKAYAFAPGIPNPGGGSSPGVSEVENSSAYTGFDLRALMILADDITTDMYSGDEANLTKMLNMRAKSGLGENSFIKAVDGEIIPTSQYKYGVDYNMGDLVEVQGNSGIIQVSRVTEYIRSQDESGEKAYPTMSTPD